MPQTFTSTIIRYADSLGRTGKLAGVITFTDGRSLKVWGSTPTIHKQCQQLAAFPPHDVRYQFKHSEKWGDSLSMIESTKTDAELYDLAQTRDEQRGRLKPNSYTGRQLSKDAQKQISEHDELMGKVG